MKEYSRARQATDGNIVRGMRCACCITKATGTHSEHVTVVAVPQQQVMRRRLDVPFVHTYIASLLRVLRSLVSLSGI